AAAEGGGTAPEIGSAVMRTWRVHELGEPTDVLVLDDVPPPAPGPGEVLIDVAASALNFPDALLCRGQYQERPALPFSPGLELAGPVRAVGAGVTNIAVGQRVAAMPLRPWGGLAQQTIALAAQAFPVPDTLADAAAAALIITYPPGGGGLFHPARLQPGATPLCH